MSARRDRLAAAATGLAVVAGLMGFVVPASPAAASQGVPRSALSPAPNDSYLEFNGTSSVVSAPPGAAFSPNAASTFEVWVKPTSCAAQCTVFVQKSQYSLFIRSGVWVLSLNSGSAWTEFTLPSKPVYGQWTHLAWSRSGVDNTFFMNGRPVRSFVYSAGFGPANTEMDIGGSTLFPSEYFVGGIDDLRIWDAARSRTEIAVDMNTYADVTSPNLKVYYDFNEGSGSTLYNSKAGAGAGSSAAIWGAPRWRSIDTTTAKVGDPDSRIVTFERSYINSHGGWRTPTGVTTVSAFAVGGGGSGGSNVGGGGGGGGSATAQFTRSGIITVMVGAPGSTGVTLTPGASDPGMNGTAGTPSIVDWTAGSITAAPGAGGLTLSSALRCDAALPLVGTGGAGGAAGQGGSAGGSGGTGRGATIDGMEGSAGHSSSFTGEARFYGGGGGAGGWNARLGVGGQGGGGSGGGTNGTTFGLPAVPNSGGGGGGSPAGCGSGGSGASGVVMLSYASSSNGACAPAVSYYTVGATSYTVATFTGAGTCSWTPPAGVTSIDYVVVGGGGGGGANLGGGGGGGGVASGTITIADSAPIMVTVGTGGVGGILPGGVNDPGGAAANGASGGSTTLSFAGNAAVAATGGGGGATYWSHLKCTGGTPSVVGTGGPGGTPVDSAGSAGGAGASAGNNLGQPGNPGVATTIVNGATTYFAGGGGSGTATSSTPTAAGGAGGVGGGGKGGYASGVKASNGAPGTGGGGGGGATICSEGGDGASGTVAMRIAQAGSTSTCAPTYSTDGDYTVATISAVGSCVFARPVGVYRADVLVVGGGGGGGSWVAGGGGGGGVVERSSVSLDASTPVTVGAGGLGAMGAEGSATFASNGARSSFGPINALGGGRGGSWRGITVPLGSIPVASQPGSAVTEQVATGGGASGNWNNWAVDRLGGAGTPGQGFAGGNAASRQGPPTFGDPFTGGGGGGAGSAGGDANVNGTAGNGGDGRASSISGLLTYYGGGGGGATHNYTNGFSRQPGRGGLGGGGNGWSDTAVSYPASAGNGADGFGGGGGAVAGQSGWLTQRAGRGGSGTVILRYKVATPADFTYLAVNAGDNQTDARGRQVFTDPSVLVTDGAGNPKSGVTVSFTVASGGGSVASATDVTDANGVASTTWTLGPANGQNTITAEVAGVDSPPVTFTASAITPVPTAVVVDSGDAQSATVGTAVTPAPVVKVVDSLAAPVEDVLVAFTVTDGGGTLVSEQAVLSDANGLATAPTWTLGTLAGGNTLRAAVAYRDSVPPVDITATAAPGAAAGLRVVTQPGATLSGVVLSAQPAVQVVDTYGNDVAAVGFSVAVEFATGTGTLIATRAISNAQGVATFTDVAVSGVAGGYVLRFTSAGLTSVVSDAFEVTRLPQTLTFGPLTVPPFSTATYGDSPISLVGAAGASSTLPPVYSSRTPAVCGASNETIVIVGGGTCTIQADQPGDETYDEAEPIRRSFTVAKAPQSALTLADVTTETGRSVRLIALGGSGNGAVAYSVVVGSAVCEVDADSGVVTATRAGECTVSAMKAGTATYFDGPPVAAMVTITKGAQFLSFRSLVPQNPLPSEEYAVTAISSAGLRVVLDVDASERDACTIAAGVVTFTGAGRCTITASQPGSAAYNAATSATQTVMVGAQNQTIRFLQPDDLKLGAAAAQLTATVTSGRGVAFALGAGTTNGACTVTRTGVVTPIAVGTCEIVTSQPGTAVLAAASDVARTFRVVPGPATAPYVTSYSSANGTATIVFDAPTNDGGSPIVGFEISARKDGGSNPIVTSRDCTVGVSPITCTIRGLAADTPYTLWVSPITESGVGTDSVRVGPFTVVDAPQGVMGLVASSDGDSLTASWAAPLDLGQGAFVHYDVSIRGPGGEWGTPQPTTDRTHTFTGLTGGPYEVKVITITTVDGVETPSNTVTVAQVPPAAPSVPTPIVIPTGTGEAVITWPLPGSDGGAAIVGYDVNVEGPDGPVACRPPLGTTSCEVSGLAPGDEYTVSVLPDNEVAAPVEQPTTFAAPTVPSAPTVTAAAKGRTGLIVKWTASQRDGGSGIIGYTVVATPNGAKGRAKAKPLRCTGLADSCVLQTKAPASSFVYVAFARNIVGASAPSAKFTAWAKASAPVAARAVLDADGTGVAATITWQPPRKAGTFPVTKYVVQTVSGTQTCTAAAKARTCTISGLAFDVRYRFTVTAYTKAGAGIASTPTKAASIKPPPAPVPGVVSGIASDSTLTVTWTNPRQPAGVTAVASFSVSIQKGTKWSKPVVVKVGTPLRAVFKRLKFKRPITARVIAVSADGATVWTATKSIVVTRTPPGPITGLKITSTAPGTAVLTWDAPADSGSGPVTSYRVNGRLISITKYSRLTSVTSATATVTGLEPGRQYYFAVVAVNEAGPGRWTKMPRPVRIR